MILWDVAALEDYVQMHVPVIAILSTSELDKSCSTYDAISPEGRAAKPTKGCEDEVETADQRIFVAADSEQKEASRAAGQML